MGSDACAAEPPAIPRFSVENMDRSVDPAVDFYRFAAGNWLKKNPVPADKSRWSGFEELQERNWQLVRQILEDSARRRPHRGIRRGARSVTSSCPPWKRIGWRNSVSNQSRKI
jgi:predicted metalloendopeptidase